MRIVKRLPLTASLVVLVGSFAPIVSVYAEDINQKIEKQETVISEIKASKETETDRLMTVLSEQIRLTEQVNALQTAIEETQGDLNVLMRDISELEITIYKRSQHIADQARHIQVVDEPTTYLEAIFSAKTLVELIEKVSAMLDITGQSLDVLEQQKQDKELLEAKQKEVEIKADEQLKSIQLVKESQKQIEVKEKEARDIIASLETEQVNALGTLTQLQDEKATIERLKQEELTRQARLKAQQEDKTRQFTQGDIQQVNQSQGSQTTALNVATNAPSPSSVSGFAMPIANATITSPFGVARSLKLLNGMNYTDVHNGVDYVNGDSNAPIVASAAGTVVYAGVDSYGGIGVIIRHDNGLYTHYWHLRTLNVSVGQTVSQSQTLGIIGATGLATGVHLHFGMSTGLFSGYVNPVHYLP